MKAKAHKLFGGKGKGDGKCVTVDDGEVGYKGLENYNSCNSNYETDVGGSRYSEQDYDDDEDYERRDDRGNNAKDIDSDVSLKFEYL